MVKYYIEPRANGRPADRLLRAIDWHYTILALRYPESGHWVNWFYDDLGVPNPGSLQEITEEEAAMILFQAKEPA